MYLERLYRDEDSLPIPLSKRRWKVIQDQILDNRIARSNRVQAVSSGCGDERDLLSLFCEMPLPTPTITANFSITEQQLMYIRSADPTSIVSCVQCLTHLPDTTRPLLLRQLRVLSDLGAFKVGDLVELSTLCVLLCDGCSDREAQARENARLMPYPEYLKTLLWEARRYEALNRAGHRCQACGRGRREVTLDVHHNSYERLGKELPEDLVVLCRDHHRLFHGSSPAA